VADTNGAHARPAWFSEALAVLAEEGEAQCAGATIRFRRWIPPGTAGVPGISETSGTPTVVLVHGTAAHSHWWDHIAPSLAADRQVVALDMSGHGASDRRAAYAIGLWAREVLAVAAAVGAANPVFVGHSMGGTVALAAAMTAAAQTNTTVRIARPRSVILLDTAIHPAIRPGPREATRLARASAPTHVYPSREEAVRRFRTLPDQGASLSYVLDHIARTSAMPVEGGWTWRLDRKVFGYERLTLERLAAVTFPVTLIRAEHGIISPELAERMARAASPLLRVVPLPGAHHHAMIDRPLETIAAIREALPPSGGHAGIDHVGAEPLHDV
jgi:pimeloyl-ACP methyl ester carboxylesterase